MKHLLQLSTNLLQFNLNLLQFNEFITLAFMQFNM